MKRPDDPAVATPAEILIHSADLARRVDELAQEILAASEDVRELAVVGLLRGAYVFTADLARALSRRGFVLSVDFMTLASYGSGTDSSGQVQLRGELPTDLAGRSVLLIEDILDSGRTLEAARRYLLAAQPTTLRSVVLLDKPSRRVVPIEADHVGFQIPDRFVVGYGLDHAGRYRELPHIAVLEDTARDRGAKSSVAS